MRLGDLDALKKEIVDLKLKLRSENQDYYTGYICALSVVEGVIAHAPTIDAVPVVRCKDCMRGCKSKLDKDAVWCSWFVVETRPDGFCSYGERKGGDA